LNYAKKIKLNIRIVIIIIYLIISSCADQNKELERISFQTADSLFIANKSNYESIADSLCQELSNLKKQFWIDSIIQIRKEQIIKLQNQQ